MVMNGGWFIIAIPTLDVFASLFLCAKSPWSRTFFHFAAAFECEPCMGPRGLCNTI